jgi:hypothetical protein
MKIIGLLTPVLATGALLAGAPAAGAAAPHTQYSVEIGFALHPALEPTLHAIAIAAPGSTTPLPAGTHLRYTTTGSFAIGRHFVLRIAPFSGLATSAGTKFTIRLNQAERHLIRAAAHHYHATRAFLTTTTSVVGSRVTNKSAQDFTIPGP